MSTCGTCYQEITECDVCYGKKCMTDCPDRIEDGCTCSDEEPISEESDDEEEW